MQNIEVYDKPNSSYHKQILKTLKQWYHQHDLHFSPVQGQSLYNICKNIYDACQQQIKQLTNKLQQALKNRHQVSLRLIQSERQNYDIKSMIERYEEQKKEFSLKLQESVRELQREKQQNSIQLKLKSKIEEQNLQLSINVNRKQSEIFTLNLNLENLKCEISQMSERDSQLALTNRQLKQKCQIYELKEEWMKYQNDQLKVQVDKLKRLIQEKKELLNRYISSQQIQQSQSVAQKDSVYDGYSENGEQYQKQQIEQIEQNQQNIGNDRQCFQSIQDNYKGQTFKMSGYYNSERFRQRISPIDSDNSQSKMSAISNNSEVSNKERNKTFTRSKNKGDYNSQQCLDTIKLSTHLNILQTKQDRKKSVAVTPQKLKLQFDQIQERQDSQASDKDSIQKINNYFSQINRLKKVNKQLLEQVKFLKRNNSKSTPPWMSKYRHQDFEDLQNKVQFFKRISHQNHQKFLEIRQQKQQYEVLSRTLQQKFQLQENTYREILGQKINQFVEQYIKKVKNVGNRFQEGIIKVFQLNSQILQNNKIIAEKKIEKDQFNIMLNELPSQLLLDLNFRNPIQTSRHNISEDHSLQIGELFQGHELHSDRKVNSVGLRTSRILQAHRELQQESDSGYQIINKNQEEYKQKIQYNDYEVQTEEVICFSSLQQAKMKGFYQCYFEQNQVQTQFHIYQNIYTQNVGIQVDFKVQDSSQTDISNFTNNDSKHSLQKDKSSLTIVNQSIKIQNELFNLNINADNNFNDPINLTTPIKLKDVKQCQTQIVKVIDQDIETDQILSHDYQCQSIQKSHLHSQTDQISVDEQGSQCYQTDHNYTQTINKKNVFKISLNLQYSNQMRLIKAQDNQIKTKSFSSRVDPSTARNSCFTNQSEIMTDRKYIQSPIINKQKNVSFNEQPFLDNNQIHNNKSKINQIQEEVMLNEQQKDLLVNQNKSLEKIYQNHQIQTQFFMLTKQIGIQTQQDCCGVIISRRQYYLLTRQSEEDNQDSENVNNQSNIIENQNLKQNSIISEQFSQQQSNINFSQQFATDKKQKEKINQQANQMTNDKSYVKIQRSHTMKQSFSQQQNKNIKSTSKKQNSPKLDFFDSGFGIQGTNTSSVKQSSQQKDFVFENPFCLNKNYHSKSNNILSIISNTKQNEKTLLQENDQFELDAIDAIQLSISQKSNQQLTCGKQMIKSLFNKDQNQVKYLKYEQSSKDMIWNANEIYIMKVELNQNQQVKDQFIFWKEGLFSLKTQDYLKSDKSCSFINDPNMLILGDNEITAWSNHIWVRKREQNGCFHGSIRNSNWKIITRYCYTIQ